MIFLYNCNDVLFLFLLSHAINDPSIARNQVHIPSRSRRRGGFPILCRMVCHSSFFRQPVKYSSSWYPVVQQQESNSISTEEKMSSGQRHGSCHAVLTDKYLLLGKPFLFKDKD